MHKKKLSDLTKLEHESKLLNKAISILRWEALLICGYSNSKSHINYILEHEEFSLDKNTLKKYINKWKAGETFNENTLKKFDIEELEKVIHLDLSVKLFSEMLKQIDESAIELNLLGILSQPGIITK